jgi:replication-associated recombination protein RarA
LPDQLRDALFYIPGQFGYEKKVAERLEWWAKLKRGETGGETPDR